MKVLTEFVLNTISVLQMSELYRIATFKDTEILNDTGIFYFISSGAVVLKDTELLSSTPGKPFFDECSLSTLRI